MKFKKYANLDVIMFGNATKMSPTETTVQYQEILKGLTENTPEWNEMSDMLEIHTKAMELVKEAKKEVGKLNRLSRAQAQAYVKGTDKPNSVKRVACNVLSNAVIEFTLFDGYKIEVRDFSEEEKEVVLIPFTVGTKVMDLEPIPVKFIPAKHKDLDISINDFSSKVFEKHFKRLSKMLGDVEVSRCEDINKPIKDFMNDVQKQIEKDSNDIKRYFQAVLKTTTEIK